MLAADLAINEPMVFAHEEKDKLIAVE